MDHETRRSPAAAAPLSSPILVSAIQATDFKRAYIDLPLSPSIRCLP